ncbi:MAG: hypothetical protein HYR63_12025 [Proteobacteria bacterium]|nr:hypothetical protein [Pseudomonadota bacterium]MBI3498510.1 hypothetical protein [Pseudomonadota bacterium]
MEDYFKAAERAEQQALSPNRHDPSGDLGRQVLALARAPSRRVIEREMVEVRNPDGSIIRVQKTAEPQRYRSSAELQAGGLARIENGFDRGQGRR